MELGSGPSHRERVRAMTVDEIKRHGYSQIAGGGPTALSLNGIAKTMGMSGPAMYRYFASRDELLSVLVTESYEDLAGALTEAASSSRRRAPAGRLRTVAQALRAWALVAPHRYRLVFGSTYGSGDLDPSRIVPASNRSMAVLLAALNELAASPPAAPHDGDLRRQLEAWGARTGVAEPSESGRSLCGLLAWTRLHGVISLEIEGFFTNLGVEAGRIYHRAIDDLISEVVADRTGR